MKRRSPRSRYRVSLGFAAAFLLFVGTVCHWRAFRLQRRAVFDRLDDIERRVSALSVASEPRQDEKSPPRLSGRDEIFDSGGVRSSVSVPRPRFLGHGRTGRYFYADVRLPSGRVNRYFLSASASRPQVSRWVANIVADVDDDIFFLDSGAE